MLFWILFNIICCSFPTEISVLEDNKALESILSEFQMPTVKYGTLKIAGFGETICMILF